jgi:hypothetical protein
LRNRNEAFRLPKTIRKTFNKNKGRLAAKVTESLPARWAIKTLITTLITIVGITGMRSCHTCHHLKRPEIDRRLAAGEPLARIAPDYGLTTSSLYRHRTNCLKLASSNAIAKEVARGTAALALLPTKETLSGAYFELRDRIDQIVRQAEQQGALKVALSGLNSIRQTLDSLARLAGHDGAAAATAIARPRWSAAFVAMRRESWASRNSQRHIRRPMLRWMAATLDGRVQGSEAVFEAKFMLPWSFSEEAAALKYMPQLQHNMWMVAARSAVLSIITGGKWIEITAYADRQHLRLLNLLLLPLAQTYPGAPTVFVDELHAGRLERVFQRRCGIVKS